MAASCAAEPLAYRILRRLGLLGRHPRTRRPRLDAAAAVLVPRIANTTPSAPTRTSKRNFISDIQSSRKAAEQALSKVSEM